MTSQIGAPHMASSRYSLNQNKYLIDPEFERLTYLLESHLNNHQRDCCLLLLALHTGGRAMEILNIRKRDLNEHQETVFLKGLKGSNDREIPLKSWLFKSVNELVVNVNNRDDRVFQISYNRLRQIWQFYRPVLKSFHCLRHTFAIRLYKKTKDIRLVQVALGHRNIANTMIYAEYVYSQQELRRLIL